MNTINRFWPRLLLTFVTYPLAALCGAANGFGSVETPETPKPIYLAELRSPSLFYESVDDLINVHCNYAGAMQLLEYHKKNGAGKYDAMIAKLERLVIPQLPPPHEAEVLVRKARFQMDQNRVLEAERELRACIAKYPSYPPAYTNLGICLLGQKRNKEGFAIIRRGTEVARPFNMHQLTDLAAVYLVAGEFKKAAEVNTEKLKIDPQDLEALGFFVRFSKDGQALPKANSKPSAKVE